MSTVHTLLVVLRYGYIAIILKVIWTKYEPRNALKGKIQQEVA